MIKIERRLAALEQKAAPPVVCEAVRRTIELGLGRPMTPAEERYAAKRYPRWSDLLIASQRPRPRGPGEPAPAPPEGLEAA